jgi:hypothetical protein
MLNMLFLTLRIDQDIVQIDNTEIVNITSQGIVNIALEGYWSIGQAHWHN